jgi:recombination protein RecR
MELPSRHLQNAVEAIATLPGIGRKTALRLALKLMQRDEADIRAFADAILGLKTRLAICPTCHNVSDGGLCSICSHPKRDDKTLCVVEDLRDIMAIESTQQFRGRYHVLGGVISPMDGVGPSDLNIDSLLQRVDASCFEELIFALPATMEGDTTGFYLFKKLADREVRISVIARGIGVGAELEYTDEITLGRSILQRTPFEQSLSR